MTEYAELHCHSHFSFGDGVDSPQQLVDEAVRLGLSGLALTDHDGFYGAVQFAEAARSSGIATVFGAELSLDMPAPQRGNADPAGQHLVVIARDAEGYRRLSHAMTTAQLTGEKGRPVYSLLELANQAGGHWLVLTGCRKGAVPRAWQRHGPRAAERELERLSEAFGRGNLAVELTRHGLPDDSERVDALAELATRHHLDTVATNNVHYGSPSRQRLAHVQAATRARRQLDELDGWLPAAATAHLRGADEMAVLFADHPGAVEKAAQLAAECAFDLTLLRPRLPDFDIPEGHTESSYLVELTMAGARELYGSRSSAPAAYRQLDHELEIIYRLDFSGYFLIVHDIVDFANSRGILCQGRGSAANSAVCYALGITKVDAVSFGLLFERFLSVDRDGPPDIDLDIESGRREEVIQYVYQRYGRERCAQVANVISYRPRSAVQDVAKALGHDERQAVAWSKQLERGGTVTDSEADELPEPVATLAEQLLSTPRHLGLHPGGMVICAQPVSQICPIEWAAAAERSVLQWDKDDCATAGLVKFDLLGLGMLSALHDAITLIDEYHGTTVDLARLPTHDEDVYALLRAADTVGVFQVESRAQIGILPRLRPSEFYDLVVEVALVRPGPIQGGSVHPYLRRREEKKRHDTESWRRQVHPRLHQALEKTYGVPLFQEQLMQMAMEAAGFDASEADQLRRAMGSKRSAERMASLKGRLYEGMAARGITGEAADEIYAQLSGFADFGFPESHAASFAFIVYASAWLKCHYPAAFTAGLLNSQPMGFYSTNTLVADARRHGVEVRRPDVNLSQATASLEPAGTAAVPPVHAAAAIRLGLSEVRGVNATVARRIAAAKPYADMADLARRARLNRAQLEALATADACACFGLDRRAALWAAGAAARADPNAIVGTTPGLASPPLPGMSDVELSGADYWALNLSPDSHPVQFVRGLLDAGGIAPIDTLHRRPYGTRVWVAGLVTHRQRPSTAGGVTFLNLEDETGMLNVICSEGLWRRYRAIARTASALRIRGIVEGAFGAVNLLADKLEVLELPLAAKGSRDFR